MVAGSRLVRSLLVLGPLALTNTAFSCAESGVTVVYNFEFASCPRPDYMLPIDTAVGKKNLTSRLSRNDRAEACEGFTTYRFRNPGSKPKQMFYYARLNRGAVCSLDLAWGYVRTTVQEGDSTELRLRPTAQMVARLLAGGAGVELRMPAKSSQSISGKDLDASCQR